MQNKLNKLLSYSYSPYSGVKVAAIVVLGTKEYKGINVENAAFGSTMCAERNAMFSAISDGHKAGDIKEIHLTSSLKKPIYPCGACSQVMTELCSNDLKIYIYFENKVQIYNLKQLLPMAFDKGSF